MTMIGDGDAANEIQYSVFDSHRHAEAVTLGKFIGVAQQPLAEIVRAFEYDQFLHFSFLQIFKWTDEQIFIMTAGRAQPENRHYQHDPQDT